MSEFLQSHKFGRKSAKVVTYGRFQLIMYRTVQLILTVGEVIFYAGKTRNRLFRRVFEGAQDFFDPLNCPRVRMCARTEAPYWLGVCETLV